MRVHIGWLPHEIEMLSGAMICEDEGDDNAIRDCADLLARKYELVRRKANELRGCERQSQLDSVRDRSRPLTWLTRPIDGDLRHEATL